MNILLGSDFFPNLPVEVLKLKTALGNHASLVHGKSLAPTEGKLDLRCLNIPL